MMSSHNVYHPNSNIIKHLHTRDIYSIGHNFQCQQLRSVIRDYRFQIEKSNSRRKRLKTINYNLYQIHFYL